MRLNKKPTAALLAAAAALVVVPASAAPASAAMYAGTLHRGWITGIPATVHRGHTITIELWFRQFSAYDLYTGSYGLYLWNPAGITGKGESAPGVSVSWLDPRTKRWMPSTDKLDKNSTQIYMSTSGDIKATSGKWIHIYARVTFDKTVKLGKWQLAQDAPQSYYLLTKSGKGTSALLKQNRPPLQPINVAR